MAAITNSIVGRNDSMKGIGLAAPIVLRVKLGAAGNAGDTVTFKVDIPQGCKITGVVANNCAGASFTGSEVVLTTAANTLKDAIIDVVVFIGV
jgi:hypothetical protein